MNQLQVAHQFLQNTVADTQSELTALRVQRDSLTTSLSNSQHRIVELDQFVATLKKEIVQSQEAARQTMIEKEEALARFKRERHELHSSIAALRQEKEAVVKSLLDEKELTVRALLEEKAATVKSLLQEKETAVTALVAEKESVIAALAKEKESVASQLENESASRQIIELALERIRAELDELRVSKETIDAELQREQLSHRLVEKKLRDEKNHYAAILEQEHLERLEIESSLQSDLDELHERIHAAQKPSPTSRRNCRKRPTTTPEWKHHYGSNRSSSVADRRSCGSDTKHDCPKSNAKVVKKPRSVRAPASCKIVVNASCPNSQRNAKVTLASKQRCASGPSDCGMKKNVLWLN
jgi:chromosome segregation ATPase